MILSEPVPLVLLPWQQDQWQSMQAAVRSDRLGHALLIQGPAGIGKRRFADLLAASVLCAQPRAVYRIAPAEAMNPVAANSLLKTLEEPASATLWLLVAEAPSSLPATVRSRCHKLTMPPPAAEQALAWLRGELAGGEGGGDGPAAGSDAEQLLVLGQGAPLRALALAGETDLQAREQCLTAFQQVSAGQADPIAVAKAWQSLEPRLVLDWLVGWVSDWLRLQMDPHAAYLINPDQRRRLAGIASGVGAAGGHRFLQQLYAARSEAQSSVNKQLLFESLLLRWAALTRPRAQGRAG